jgi:RsmE family RNA methyltransferase
VVADPSATTPLGDVARASSEGRMLLAIGPEGGWNAFELGLLQTHRFQPAGMGPRALRTDTACIALLAIARSSRESSGFRVQISD